VTRDERDLRVMAMDLMILAGEHDAETKIAAALAAFRRATQELDASVCRYLAREWRDPQITIDDHGRSLRERSAEAADLCASRIAPSPLHGDPSKEEAKDG